MNIAISIVSYNTRELLNKCLGSIFKMENKNNFEVWVVDNYSSDGSQNLVKKDFPQVHLIENNENSGFAKGHNLALKKIKADFILILNSDTEVAKNSLEDMIDFMKDNPDCGLASCKILDSSGNLQPNGGDLPLGTAFITWLFNLEFIGNLPNFHRNEKKYYETAHEVGWLSGSFLLVRKEVFEKIGYLNEDYFMYFEDVEFCFKAHHAGFKIMINPNVVIKHVGGASSKDPSFRQWCGEMKGLIYFYKNTVFANSVYSKQFGIFFGNYIRVLIYASIFLRIIAFMIIGKFNVAKTYGRVVGNI